MSAVQLYYTVLYDLVVRGFLGRCVARRRKDQAEVERIAMEALLKQIGDCSVSLMTEQSNSCSSDRDIPKGSYIRVIEVTGIGVQLSMLHVDRFNC